MYTFLLYIEKNIKNVRMHFKGKINLIEECTEIEIITIKMFYKKCMKIYFWAINFLVVLAIIWMIFVMIDC